MKSRRELEDAAPGLPEGCVVPREVLTERIKFLRDLVRYTNGMEKGVYLRDAELFEAMLSAAPPAGWVSVERIGEIIAEHTGRHDSEPKAIGAAIRQALNESGMPPSPPGEKGAP